MADYTPYSCPTCGHAANRHFALGTKCAVEDCDCMESQHGVISKAQAAHVDRLEAENAKLREKIGTLADIAVRLLGKIPYGDNPYAAGYIETQVDNARALLDEKGE